jgi:hypothetical protein
MASRKLSANEVVGNEGEDWRVDSAASQGEQG